ncbi:hypothetical protein D3C79_964790 [compost metagenome]
MLVTKVHADGNHASLGQETHGVLCLAQTSSTKMLEQLLVRRCRAPAGIERQEEVIVVVDAQRGLMRTGPIQ